MDTYQEFLKSIHEKKFLTLEFDSIEKGVIRRKCVPFDFGPSRRHRSLQDRYHFYDLDSPEGQHNLSILPEQVLSISILNESFDPAEFVKWPPDWFVSRDWGAHS